MSEVKYAPVCQGSFEGICAAYTQLEATNADLLAALQCLVASVEHWNEAVEKIIGRQPDTGIALTEAKEAIAKAKGG